MNEVQVHKRACMHARTNASKYACMHACMHARMYACMHARTHNISQIAA